jgi:hypothetical protein
MNHATDPEIQSFQYVASAGVCFPFNVSLTKYERGQFEKLKRENRTLKALLADRVLPVWWPRGIK